MDCSTLLDFKHIPKDGSGWIGNALIGTGLTTAINPDFCDETLRLLAIRLSKSKDLKRYLQVSSLDTIEVRLSRFATDRARRYGFVESLVQREMKSLFLSCLIECHLIQPTVPTSKIEPILTFFRNFRSVFDTNYDLYTYQITMHENERMDDGFRPFPPKRDQLVYSGYSCRRRLHHLHGSIGFFVDGKKLVKLSAGSSGKRIAEIAMELVKRGKHPLFITAEKHQTKQREIADHEYLNDGLSHLKRCQQTLVAFGHSGGTCDQHILDAIARNSGIRKVYWGIYGDPGSEANRGTMARVRKMVDLRESNFGGIFNLEVYFYQSETALELDPNRRNRELAQIA